MNTGRLVLLFTAFLFVKCVNPGSGEKNKESEGGEGVTNVTGIDISEWQGNELANPNVLDGLSFAICRASYGDEPDSKFQSNWNTIKSKKIIGGMYHYYYGNLSYVEQANEFMRALSNLSSTDLPPIIDIEDTSFYNHCNEPDQIKKLTAFIQQIETRSGRVPLLYMNLSCGNECLDSDFFTQYPLYIAYYDTKIQQPPVPKGWVNKGWVFWQRTFSDTLDGYLNDFDVFNGTREDLLEFIKNSNK
ncbi:MAG TPA: GH25 family lysozyme [Flavobacteriales bacterium]|nr:GH25 family lysozyme [Flavobacteriales bacterium]